MDKAGFVICVQPVHFVLHDLGCYPNVSMQK
jgi:hypothetical protein